MRSNLGGMRVGKITVVEPTEQRKNRYIMWKCRCDCGNELLVESRHLKRGTIKDCGCSSVKAKRDLRNQRFGKLLVVNETEKRANNGNVVWECQCDCGNVAEVSSHMLLNGYKKSCGCLRERRDWIGKKFGYLTVIEYGGKEKRSHMWVCHCECGKVIRVRQSNLQSGHTKSCGCKFSIHDSHHFVDGTCIEIISSKKISRNNVSGIRGVYWSKSLKKWVAQITFKKVTYYLGAYENINDAAQARKRGEERYFQEFLDEYHAKNKEDS